MIFGITVTDRPLAQPLLGLELQKKAIVNKQFSTSTISRKSGQKLPSLRASIQPLVDPVTIQEKLDSLLNALVDEQWLPHGLRSLVVEELISAKCELANPFPEIDEIGRRIHSIALTSFAYSDLVLQSKTISKIRAFDLELTPFSTLRQPQRVENPVASQRKVG